VLIEDVEGIMEQVGVEADVPEAIERLIESGLMEDDPGLEIRFSGIVEQDILIRTSKRMLISHQ